MKKQIKRVLLVVGIQLTMTNTEESVGSSFSDCEAGSISMEVGNQDGGKDVADYSASSSKFSSFTGKDEEDSSKDGSKDAQQNQQLASEESKAVSRTKLIFILILIAAGIAASVLTYVFLTREEYENFAVEVRRERRSEQPPCLKKRN